MSASGRSSGGRRGCSRSTTGRRATRTRSRRSRSWNRSGSSRYPDRRPQGRPLLAGRPLRAARERRAGVHRRASAPSHPPAGRPPAARRARLRAGRDRRGAGFHARVGLQRLAACPRRDRRTPARAQSAGDPALHRRRGLREVTERFVAAWEANDVSAIVALLTDDATISMPPRPSWYRGREAIAAFLAAHPMAPVERWRIVAVAANGHPAFAMYGLEEDGSWTAHAIQAITLGRRRSHHRDHRVPRAGALPALRPAGRADALARGRRWIRAAARISTPDGNETERSSTMRGTEASRMRIVGPGHRVGRLVHGRARHAGRHHRADHDPPRPRGLDRAARMDRQRLQPELRGPADDRRGARRPVRAPQRVRRRASACSPWRRPRVRWRRASAG